MDASKVMKLWKAPNSAEMLNEANQKLEADRTVRDLQQMKTSIEMLKQRLQSQENLQGRQDAINADTMEKVSILEEETNKSRVEVMSLQRQIEALSVNFERERGLIADQQEQIRYLTRELNSRHLGEHAGGAGGSGGVDGAKALWAVFGWIYTPIMQIIRGVWFIFLPIIATFQNLTLFHPSLLPSSSTGGDGDGDDCEDGGVNGGAGGGRHRMMGGANLGGLVSLGGVGFSSKPNPLQQNSAAVDPTVARNLFGDDASNGPSNGSTGGGNATGASSLLEMLQHRKRAPNDASVSEPDAFPSVAFAVLVN